MQAKVPRKRPAPKIQLTQAKVPKTLEKRASARDLSHTVKIAKEVRDEDKTLKIHLTQVKMPRR